MEYITTEGVKLKLFPVSPLKIQKVVVAIEKMFEKVEKPKYCEELPNGKLQCFVHDEKSILQTDEQDEIDQWQAWEKYQQTLNAEKAERTTALIIYDGIELETIPEDWIEQHKWLGIEIPDNKFDLKVHYITTELIKSVFDLQEIIVSIRELGMKGVDQDAVTAAENSFRDSQES